MSEASPNLFCPGCGYALDGWVEPRMRDAEARAETLEKALRDIEQWTQVAFYPGPNENPHFQAGFQEAVGITAGIVARLMAAAPTPPEAQGREEVGRAAFDVLAERRRQISEEGWDAEHDDQHSQRELSTAAACYCLGPSHVRMPGHDTPAKTGSIVWPWSPEWWKPKNRRRDLIRAAALVIAEIDRLDRYAANGGERRATEQGGAGGGRA